MERRNVRLNPLPVGEGVVARPHVNRHAAVVTVEMAGISRTLLGGQIHPPAIVAGKINRDLRRFHLCLCHVSMPTRRKRLGGCRYAEGLAARVDRADAQAVMMRARWRRWAFDRQCAAAYLRLPDIRNHPATLVKIRLVEVTHHHVQFYSALWNAR